MNTIAESLLHEAEVLGPWMMRHELPSGIWTPVVPGCAAAHQPNYDSERAHFIFSFLNSLCGVQGHSVLDLGCASGYYTFDALNHGATYATGVEFRELHVRQARFLARVYGVDEICDFQQITIEEGLREASPVDIVFCLDVLQYLLNPISVLNRIRTLTKRALVLDLYVLPPRAEINFPNSTRSDLSKWILLERARTVHQKHGLHGWTFLPTFAALREMLDYAGFRTVVGLKPPPEWASTNLPLGKYVRNERRIIVCFTEPIELNMGIRTKCYNLHAEQTAATFEVPSRNAGRLRRAVKMTGALRLLPWLIGRAMVNTGMTIQSWATKRERSTP